MEKALIIEDDKDISELISIHLNDMDLEVDQAFDGKDGLMKALNNRYRFILLDIRLPLLDGFEVCKTHPHGKEPYAGVNDHFQIRRNRQGTEVNEYPGAQTSADTVEDGDVRLVDDGFMYPDVNQMIKVTIWKSE